MKKWTLLLIGAVFGFGTELYAQEENDDKGIEISGFADIYYQYNLNGSPAGLTSFTEKHNSFELGMANVVFSKSWEKVGVVVDLAFGPRADIANGYAGSTLAPIKQLYVTYSFTDDLVLTAGNFGTFVGYEIIDAPGNFNYSTSYLFSYGPFYHTGLKLDYAVSETFGLMAGIFNETDAKLDLNNNKHFGAQASFTRNGLNAYLNFLTGREDGVDGSGNNGYQYDLTATYDVTDAFMLGLNASHKTLTYAMDESTGNKPSNDTWYGTAIYANYWATSSFGFGLRGEYFNDTDALNIFDMSTYPDGGDVFEFTVSANLKQGPLTFIPEFRIDKSSQDIFTDGDGNGKEITPSLLGAVYVTF